MHTTQSRNSLISSIGLPTVIAAIALSLSTLNLIGSIAYSSYFEQKVEPIQVSESRKDLEQKHRELLSRSGFKSDVVLNSVPDKTLKELNYKLESAIRKNS
jgi:hypothetical protein